MIKYINVVKLPEICFPGTPTWFRSADKLKTEKFLLNPQVQLEIDNIKIETHDVKSIITNKNLTIYAPLDIRKNLLIDAEIKSGDVQKFSCDYYIHALDQVERYCFQKVKDVLELNYNSSYYEKTVEVLNNALDFELIDENDYVQMAYQWHSAHKYANSNWHLSSEHDASKVLTLEGVFVPNEFKCLSIHEVYKHCNNSAITSDQLNKVKTLLSNRDTEKIAVTILNTINPYTSFIELICIINHMKGDIKKNVRIPIMPLINKGYNTTVSYSRNADQIVQLYEKIFSVKASNEILEKVADNYYSPHIERSSIFDFKLKLKK